MMTPRTLAAALAGALFVAVSSPATAQQFDLLIRGGQVIDGTGSAPRRADVAVTGGRIVRIGDLTRATAARTIDATGRMVTPGFIDMHSHADWGFGTPELNVARNNLTQGITTVVVGQDGRSAWRVGEKATDAMKVWREQGLSENSILLVGHGSVRREVMGNEDRAPTADELVRMRALVREAMEQGAYGISTGLGYVPGRFSTTPEVIALTKEVQPFGGFYISHLRNQGDNLMQSVDETILIGRESGVPVVLSHFKSAGARNFGKAKAAMDRIAEARKQGVVAWVDVYPWSTSSDGIDVDMVPRPAYTVGLESNEEPALATVLPTLSNEALARLMLDANRFLARTTTEAWLAKRPREELLTGATQALRSTMMRANDDVLRANLRASMADPARRDSVRGIIERALTRQVPQQYVIERAVDSRVNGKTLPEAAAILGLDVVDAAVELDLMGAVVTHYHMSEPDVEAILGYDFTSISTDGTLPYFGVGVPHPRSYGSFTRLIDHYVRERKAMTLPGAVRAASGLAADIIGLADRGYLKEGQWADVLVFDPAKISTCTTFAQPHCYSTGIDYMLVNGELTLNEGKYTGALAGRIITPAEARTKS
ncbi:MAG TPA: amidohydrolase family protein [Gemmatimonadaceae bacterium]|nr:amidohydrolase family protein [Gemmatimonadaceae bacterium]